jgi:hypothetical protein
VILRFNNIIDERLILLEFISIYPPSVLLVFYGFFLFFSSLLISRAQFLNHHSFLDGVNKRKNEIQKNCFIGNMDNTTV